jgi:hypothetical protein
MNFGSVHINVSSLAASAMEKLFHNISTNEIEEFAFNYDSEEQCTSDVSGIEGTYDIRTQ